MTDFTKENDEFSEEAHLVAQKQAYPIFFNDKPLIFNNTHLKLDTDGCGFLDGQHAVDRVIRFGDKPNDYSTWAERFRKMEFYDDYKDELTITYMNPSGVVSEWFKLGFVQYMMYGFYDIVSKRIVRWIVIDAIKLNQLKDDMVWITPPPNFKGQIFKAINVYELRKKGLVLDHSIGYDIALQGIKIIKRKQMWYKGKQLKPMK